jgi:hypothetical protein
MQKRFKMEPNSEQLKRGWYKPMSIPEFIAQNLVIMEDTVTFGFSTECRIYPHDLGR